MDPFETLSLCAEIAIGITGFSGVVLVLGDGNRGPSVEMERVLFRVLFAATLVPLGLIAIAFILEASAFEHDVIWRVCSCLHVLAVSVSIFFNLRALSHDRYSRTRGGPFVLLGITLVILLQLANAVAIHAFWPLLIAVWWSLSVSLYAFVNLVFPPRTA